MSGAVSPGPPGGAASGFEVASNIARTLVDRAATDPGRSAVILPDARGSAPRAQWTFAELDQVSAAVAAGLQDIGLTRGERCVLMVPPSLEFFALVFGLFRGGIVPVVVDPGIGLKFLSATLAEARPSGFIGIPKANAARVTLGWARDTIRTVVTTGRFRAGKGFTLREVLRRGGHSPTRGLTSPPPGDPAAILFTSGSTGVPKGVVYTHDNFLGQVEALRETFGIAPGEVDLCTFPLFALFAPALGMTAVVPEMDPSRPARARPEKLLATANGFGVTNFFGSPALIRNLALHGGRTGAGIPTLRRAISAGAPVPARVVEAFVRLLPRGVELHTPYGATEALPVSTIGSREILEETRRGTELGRGVCVGRPLSSVRVELVRVEDGPLPVWSNDLRVRPGEIGEITVEGAVVTREYFGRPEATRLAKIERGGKVLHRMGDLAWQDDRGRLWFCGRKSQRVVCPTTTHHTIPCEGVFDSHPEVRRTALVGARSGGGVEPVLCIELERRASRRERQRIARELANLGAAHEVTRPVRRFLFHRAFPVDIRHNAKIGREKLATWAEGQLS